MWLGIDIGTSGVKAVLIDDTGTSAGQATAPLTVNRPRPHWSEQHPDDWWAATQAAVLALPASARAAVRGIGLSGQMHGAVLLGVDDRPLRPAILWNDGRSGDQCRALATSVDVEGITGNLAMPGLTAPKLLWVRDHEPEIFAATQTILLPKDYVRLMLTGDKASDVSNGGLEWSSDSKNIYYLLNDPTVRSYRAMSHTIGTPTGQDKLIFEEKDNTFSVGIDKAKRCISAH